MASSIFSNSFVALFVRINVVPRKGKFERTALGYSFLLMLNRVII